MFILDFFETKISHRVENKRNGNFINYAKH